MPTPTARAVLLDIDGTLADSNYLHVDAWSRALEDVDRPTDAWRIHRAIGMDSGKLLEALLGDDADELGERATRRHATHYARDRRRIRPFADAQRFVRTLHDRGFRVVLATSAAPEEYAALTEVLDLGDAVDSATTSEDVEQAKPAPDVVGVALERAEVRPEDAVMIGDAVWDVRAGATAGVRVIGVRSGGVGAAELSDAGAIAVYDDVAHLLRELDASPLYER